MSAAFLILALLAVQAHVGLMADRSSLYEVSQRTLYGGSATRGHTSRTSSTSDNGAHLERGCFTTNQFSECRVTGQVKTRFNSSEPEEPCGCCFTGIYVRTTHACIKSKHDDQKHKDLDFPSELTIRQAAVCEWHYDLFRDAASNTYCSLKPVDSGTFLQLGTMTAKCRFNEDCEDCEDSVRGSTLTITGGTYATLAFSMHPGAQKHAPAGDACELPLSMFNIINNNFERRYTHEDLAVSRQATQHSFREATPGASFADAWTAILAALVDSPLYPQLQTVIDNNANNRGSLRAKMSSGTTHEGMYAGVGFVHMGEAMIVDAAGDIQSGRVEYPFMFLALGRDIEPGTTDWPMVQDGILSVKTNKERHGNEYWAPQA